MTITLTDTEARIATWLGRMRHEIARKNGVVDRKIGPQDAMSGDINGLGGEFAFCKACGAWPDMTVRPRSGGHDAVVCGLLFDVKTTKVEHGMLLVTLKKTVESVNAYALVCGTMPTYRVAGWCWSHEVIRDDNKVNKGHGEGYGLPQGRLRSFDQLASIIGIQTQHVRRKIA